METKDHVRVILNDTFNIISETYKYQKEDCHFASAGKSRLIFPKKSDGTIRVSEQELRFIFVEQLNEYVRKNWDVYYSVETPTEYNYRFSGASGPVCHGTEANTVCLSHSLRFPLPAFSGGSPGRKARSDRRIPADFAKL